MGEKEKVPAIIVRGLKKEYRIGQIGNDTLQKDIQSWWAKARGREDPNRKIDDRERLSGDKLMALNGIDLTVYKGETLGILGKNGAGKSTLLKILSRITSPTEGRAYLYGKVTSMLEVGTGFHPEMTGRENIYVNGSILGMSMAQIRSKVEDIIDFSEIREYIDTPVKRYSSGMYVKLAFAVASHLNSEIMIMDEVLAVGDMSFQKKCLNQMRYAASQESRTVLYVSHNMNTIRELCDRCIVLDEGRIVYDGDTERAILLYLDTGFSVRTEIDYRGQPHPDWLISPGIRLLHVSYLDKDSGRYQYTEKIRMRLEWVNLIDLRDVCLRVEILTMNGDPLATYVLYDFYSGERGSTAQMDIALDPSPFSEGMYLMKYSFFRRDAAGNMINTENRTGLTFEIISAKHTGKLIWESRYWGNVVLDDIRILSLTDERAS